MPNFPHHKCPVSSTDSKCKIHLAPLFFPLFPPQRTSKQKYLSSRLDVSLFPFGLPVPGKHSSRAETRRFPYEGKSASRSCRAEKIHSGISEFLAADREHRRYRRGQTGEYSAGPWNPRTAGRGTMDSRPADFLLIKTSLFVYLRGFF